MTAQDWVYFFLGVSGLSLLVAVFFTRQVIGSVMGMRKWEVRRSHEARRGRLLAATVHESGSRHGGDRCGAHASNIRICANRTSGRR